MTWGTYWPVSDTRYSSISISCVCVSLSRVQLFATLWTVACQAPLSMGFFRQDFWSGLPFPPPEDLPDLGLNPRLLCLLHCRQILYPLSHEGSPPYPLRTHQLVGQNCCQQINSQVGEFNCQKQNHLAYKQHDLTLTIAFQKQHSNTCPKWSQNQSDFQLT